MESIESRLQQFLNMEQISAAQFADALGIQRSGLSHLLAGRNKPSFDFIEKMMTRFPQVNYEWLILGKGRPYRDQVSARTEPATAPLEENEEIPQQGLFDEEEPQSAEIKDVAPENEVPELAENPKSVPVPDIPRQILQPQGGNERHIVRITVFYSDGTFEEK